MHLDAKGAHIRHLVLDDLYQQMISPKVWGNDNLYDLSMVWLLTKLGKHDIVDRLVSTRNDSVWLQL